MAHLGLYPEDWVTLESGEKYKGGLNNRCRPEGFGIRQEGTNTFYVGEFLNGWRHGRGFLLHVEKWTEKRMVWQHGTYEEVMATAEFDSCGRVIHVDNVGKYVPDTVHLERWYITDDGVWEADKYLHDISRSVLQSPAWADALTAFSSYEFYNESPARCPTRFFKEVKTVHADGQYAFNREAFISPYDRTSLLVCDADGNVCRVEAGKEYCFLYDSLTTKKEYITYTLSMSADYKKHIDLILEDWGDNKPALARQTLYARALGSLIERCERKNRPTAAEYIKAIGEKAKEMKDEWTIEAELHNTWLYSAKAGERYRISGCDVQELAGVAAQVNDIIQYIDSKWKNSTN